MVVKSDGRRELFDRTEDRHRHPEGVREAAGLGRRDRAGGGCASSASCSTPASARCASTRIGDEVRAELRALDPVAWLRFMSVYLNFRTIEDFRKAMDELEPEDGD